jgi:hypothetical protein
VVYNTRAMRLFRSWRFARPTSLPTIAIVVCLVAFLFHWSAVPPTSEVSADHTLTTMADPPHAEQAGNGYGHSIGGIYPAISAEEGDLDDEIPPNATLLMALVCAVSYGPVLVWLLAFARTRRSSEVSSPIGRRLHSIVRPRQRRTVAAFLGIFRL